MPTYEGGAVIAGNPAWGIQTGVTGALWIFTSDNADVVTLEINPVTASSIQRTKNIAYQVGAGPFNRNLIFDQGREQGTVSITGTVLTQGQFEALELFVTQDVSWTLLDDLGRTFSIYITALSLTRNYSASAPWRHEFTLDYVVLDQS